MVADLADAVFLNIGLLARLQRAVPRRSRLARPVLPRYIRAKRGQERL
jgi:hypothetical protein